MIATNPETFNSAKRLAQMLYDHGNKKGTKNTKTKAKKEGGNKNSMGNKRKGGRALESSKKQQTVTFHVATTQISLAPAASATTTPTPTKLYAGTLPKCDKCNFHHNGACRDL